MAFMSMEGHSYSYKEFSCFSTICLHKFQKNRLHLFELTKDEVALKVRYGTCHLLWGHSVE
jgi:hypothetical protein